MPVVELGDVSLHYRRESPASGDAPAVLLIAGMASDSASWQPIMPSLAQRFDVIAPDNRCSGLTQPMPTKTSREAMLGDLIGLLDTLDIPQVAIVGHSMGAMLGWALAAHAPERVTALVALSGLPEVLPVRVDFFRTMARLRETSHPPDWYRMLLHALFSPAFFADPVRVEGAVLGALAYANRQSPEAMTAQAEGLYSFLETPPVDRVNCPVLAMTGELDALTTPLMQERRYAQEPQIEQDIIEDAAHSIHWEQPAAVVTRITEFLQRQLPRA